MNKTICYRLMVVMAVALLCLIPHKSYAVTKKDIQVATRSFGFISGIPKNSIDVAIVHDGSAASKAEADKVVAIFGGIKAKKAKLVGKLVSVDNLGNLGGAKVAYITSGLQSKWGDIFLVTSSNGVFSFSADMGCVEAHKCLLGMKSDPSVEIILSKSATSASGVKIKAAFKLMVKEI